MATLQLLGEGFASVFASPIAILMCFVGAFLGILVGILPGLGPSATIAMLLPLTYTMDPMAALIVLCGIFCGAAFGGAITSILVNIPGEGCSVPTTFDGYQLCRQGRPGTALGIAACASVVSGLISIILLAFLVKPLSSIALMFGAPEYATVVLFAFIAVVGLSEGGLVKAFFSLFVGLLCSTVGFDSQTGDLRLTFGQMGLLDGIPFLAATMGLFGLAEVLMNIVNPDEDIDVSQTPKLTFRKVMPTLKEVRYSLPAMARGGILGFFIGVLPGAGANIATFLAYSLEKRMSRHPERFGKGELRGLAAPEAADNGSVGGSMVPMLALGIPGSGTCAIILGALVMLGMQPGPMLFERSGPIVWGLIASMFISNVILFFMNTAMVPVFVWILKVSRRCLSVAVTTLCIIGIIGAKNSMNYLWIMLAFTGIGYLFKVAKIPPAPLVLALIMGGQMENSLRQSLLMSRGSFAIFVTRPISLVFVLLCIAFLVVPAINRRRKRRRQAAAQQ